MKVLDIARPDRARYQNLADLWDNPAFAPRCQAAEEYAACFEDLKQILIARNRTGRLEVTLLHRHYDIEEGEALFDFYGPGKNECTTSVLSFDEIEARRGLPGIFQFTPSGECFAVRYSDPRCIDPLTESDEECMTELGKAICRHGLENVLGIALRYRPLAADNPFPLWREQSSKRNRAISRGVVDELPPTPEEIMTHFRVDEDGVWVPRCGCPQANGHN